MDSDEKESNLSLTNSKCSNCQLSVPFCLLLGTYHEGSLKTLQDHLSHISD